MVPGFNHNVMHKGQLFHIQTEDNGLRNPYIITHLFIGGNIMDSRKTSYADIVSSPNVDELVREMMEEQHKNTLRDLKSGKFDHLTEGGKMKKGVGDDYIDDSKSLDEVILGYLSTRGS